MKRMIIVTALLLSAVAHAQADQLTVFWYDTIRPHGHKRPDAVGRAAEASCNRKVGEPDRGVIPETFKQCMAGFGYRFMSDTLNRTKTPSVTYNRDSRDPSVGWHSEAECGCATVIATTPKFRDPARSAGTPTSWAGRCASA